MVAGRLKISAESLTDSCSECGIVVSYLAAKPAASGVSICPACNRRVYFKNFMTFEVHTLKIRKFSHKIGVKEWIKQKTLGLKPLTEFA